MFEEIRVLPESGNRYKVTQYGQVLDCDYKEIPLIRINGTLHVTLNWIDGIKDYPTALIVLMAYRRPWLPLHLLKEIEFLFNDGEEENLTPQNLFYRFRNGPLAVEELPGYYYVPFYTRYAVNEQGSLINIATGKERKWSIRPGNKEKNITGGYKVITVISDTGFSSTLQQHRAIGFVFNRYGNDLWSKVSNHKDGKPWNNDPSNLEWVTRTENNLHAVENGLRPNSTRPVLMKNLVNGEIKRFASVTTCSRFLGKSSNEMIWKRLTFNPTKVYPDRLLFKYDDDSKWPHIELTSVDIHRQGQNSDMMARNVFTGEKIIFSGSVQGKLFTGVKEDTITKHARERMIRPIAGWNFRYLEEAEVWPNHTARHLKIYEKYRIYPPNGIIALDTVTKEETFFCSSREAMEYFSLGKSSLFEKIRSKKLVNKRHLLSLFELEENLGHPVE